MNLETSFAKDKSDSTLIILASGNYQSNRSKEKTYEQDDHCTKRTRDLENPE